MALEELLHPRLAEPAGVDGRGVASEERKRDRAVELREPLDRTRPEPLELRPQLAAERNALLDQEPPAAGQRPQRLRLIAVRNKRPKAVMIGSRQLAEHERVKAVRLPARRPRTKPQRPDATDRAEDSH